MGKKKHLLKLLIGKEKSNYWIGFTALIIAFISLAISIFEVIPAYQLLTGKPLLTISLISVDTTSDFSSAQFQLSNAGNAIANDIFIAMEVHKDDTVSLFFGLNGNIERKGEKCVVKISSLAPGESTSINVFGPRHKKEESEIIKLTRRLKPPSIHSIDFREGSNSDVIRHLRLPK